MAQKRNDLWEQIITKCLSQALSLLESTTAPTAATVETVKRLVDIAIAVDTLNFHWFVQNQLQSSGGTWLNCASQRQEARNSTD